MRLSRAIIIPLGFGNFIIIFNLAHVIWSYLPVDGLLKFLPNKISEGL